MISNLNEREIALDRIYSFLLRSVKEVFGDDIICMLVHGSIVKGGFIEGFSDLDVQVFLKDSSFDEFGLKLEKSLAIQKRVGNLSLSEIGAHYLQMYFYDPQKMPDWYSPPVEGSYQILYGEMPKELDYNVNNFKHRIIESLKRLRKEVALNIRNFADSTNHALYRRVRLIATIVFPTMYSLVSYGSEDPSPIWAKPKNEVLNLLCERYQGKSIIDHLQDFFKLIKILSKNHDDYETARMAFKQGIRFLSEAAKIGDEI